MILGKSVRIYILIGIVIAAAAIWGMKRYAPLAPTVSCKDCNVVLIALDPLRADALSSYGNSRPTTPNIDALARKGFLFSDAFAVAPWTLPSAMSLMTGVYPSVHHIVNKELISPDKQQKLVPARLSETAPNIKTMASFLKSRGYVTGGFAGGAALAASYGFDTGFDQYISGDSFDGLPLVIPHALEFIKKHSKEKMFLFIHAFDVHGQYMPSGGYDRRYVSASYTGSLTGATEEQKSLREEGVMGGRIYLTPQDVAFLRSIYDEKVARADEAIYQIIKQIEDLSLSEKTIVIFTSNHGDEFYEHGRIDHGMTLYDEVLHIPLIMVIPGQAGNKKITSQVRNIDIMPTIFDLVGEAPDKDFASQLNGVSLLPVLTGRDINLDLYAETDYRYATFKKSIRSFDKWKLIADEENQSKQLYHIAEDPRETREVFGQGEKKEAELIDKLLQFSTEITGKE